MPKFSSKNLEKTGRGDFFSYLFSCSLEFHPPLPLQPSDFIAADWTCLCPTPNCGIAVELLSWPVPRVTTSDRCDWSAVWAVLLSFYFSFSHFVDNILLFFTDFILLYRLLFSSLWRLLEHCCRHKSSWLVDARVDSPLFPKAGQSWRQRIIGTRVLRFSLWYNY